MRHDPVYRPITADEFLEMDFGTDKRFELHRGVIYMMAGGSEPHAWVQGNIFSWLRARLRGTGCRPYGPDMAMRISDIDIRYPDISIYCDQPPRDALTQAKLLDNPTVVIEILSLTTAMFDQGTKLEEYQALPSVRTIAFVDTSNEMCRTIERTDKGWFDQTFSGERGIPVPSLDLTIPHAEIFARD
ncbi:MAG: Uma2 family endonuclease [Pseudomonadota bacterium]|jgi:Uma2 family endonuclease